MVFQPVLLGKLLDKPVFGIAINSECNVSELNITNYPSIVIWDCTLRQEQFSVDSLLRFWIHRGARTFVFGGIEGYKVEDTVIDIIEILEKQEGFKELILTSYTSTLPEAVWQGGFTGYVDTPNDEEPRICVMVFGSVRQLRDVRSWVIRMQTGWIPRRDNSRR